MGADLDEGGVVLSGGGDGLAEAGRGCAGWPPSVRRRSAAGPVGGSSVVLIIGMAGAAGARSARALRNSGRIGSMIG